MVSDELFSGGSMDRPGFQKILLDVKMDAAPWETLIVFRMDRLTRSQLDQLIIFKTFAEHNQGIVSATEPGFDWSTPTGRCQLGVIASVNQYQREVNAENTRHKMIQIASQGLWPVWKPPFGYKRGEKHDTRLYVDEQNASVTQMIFEMYISDQYTTIDICRNIQFSRQ